MLSTKERLIVEQFKELKAAHLAAFSDGWSAPKTADAFLLADILKANVAIANGADVTLEASRLAVKILSREHGHSRVQSALIKSMVNNEEKQ